MFKIPKNHPSNNSINKSNSNPTAKAGNRANPPPLAPSQTGKEAEPLEKSENVSFPSSSQSTKKGGLKFRPRKNDILYGSGVTKKLFAKAKNDQNIDRVVANLETKLASDALKDEQKTRVNLAYDTIGFEQLDPYQREAIMGFKTNQFAVMIGAAGTGKTTSERAVVEAIVPDIPLIKMARITPDYKHEKMYATERGEEYLNQEVPAIAFMSFTGKAVSQMKRAIPSEYHQLCRTTHSWLGFHPTMILNENGEEKKQFVPYYTAYQKLPLKAVFIDEAGMLAVDLWGTLLAALHPDCRIYLIGDINQLPPVHGRSILGFGMINWPTFELKTIHRQAADNPIIMNAHRILEGKYPRASGKAVQLATIDGGSMKAQQQILSVVKALHKKGEFDPALDAIICGMNKNELGQLRLNEYLVSYFNSKAKRILIATGKGTMAFAPGDKIMLLSNDTERGLTNGMIGYIREININGDYDGDHHFETESMKGAELDLTDLDDLFAKDAETKNEIDKQEEKSIAKRQASHVTVVDFIIDDERTEEVQFKTAGDYGRMSHAYAFTCHKSQGSEYRNVIIIAHSAARTLNSREWLYTAFTRAREKVLILSNPRGLASCINNQRIKGKTLEDKAKVFTALSGDGTNYVPPRMPEAKQLTNKGE